MCYSKDASKNIFFMNILTSFILFKSDSKTVSNKILALFFLFVGFMQLFDWIFWSNQDLENQYQKYINNIFTKVAIIFNHLQPLILGILIYYYNKKLGNISKNILILYFIVFMLYTTHVLKNIKYTIKSKVTNINNEIRDSLDWEWNTTPYSLYVYTIFISSLLILSYENFNYPLNIILAFINIFTFLFSRYYFKQKFIGRFWCKIAAFIPLVIILLNKLSIIEL